jgi:hypothetical protein
LAAKNENPETKMSFFARRAVQNSSFCTAPKVSALRKNRAFLPPDEEAQLSHTPNTGHHLSTHTDTQTQKEHRMIMMGREEAPKED